MMMDTSQKQRMDEMQFESKCCRARVIQDYSDINEDNEDYTPPRWKCIKCKRIVEDVIITKKMKRLR